jgi:hypothetical protein
MGDPGSSFIPSPAKICKPWQRRVINQRAPVIERLKKILGNWVWSCDRSRENTVSSRYATDRFISIFGITKTWKFARPGIAGHNPASKKRKENTPSGTS